MTIQDEVIVKQIASFRGPLHAGTLDLHHYIEHETELGRVMASGTPDARQYLSWLRMKSLFFRAVETGDPPMLPAAHRSALYDADAAALSAQLSGWEPPAMPAAVAHAEWLSDPAISATERERRRTGTIYVCAGSVFGAAVIRKRILDHAPDWPVESLQFRDRAAELAYIHQLRQRGDCIAEARACFAAMIAACDEVDSTLAA